MAQGIRSRSVALLLAAVAACGKTGADRQGAAPEPRHVDTASIPDSAIVAAILDECHKPLRGRMDRVAAEVRRPDGSILRVFAHLPESMRCIGFAGMFLLRDEQGYRLDKPDPTPGDEKADQRDSTTQPDELAQLRRLRVLLDAASFGPLHRATSCRRTASGQFELQQATGASWTVTLRPGTLLPERFANGEFTVHVRDYLRTKTTWVVQQAEIDGLGICDITFEQADLTWEPDFFQAPENAPPAAAQPAVLPPTAAGPGQKLIPYAPQGVAEPRSPTPILVDARAVEWVLLEDPGTWPERTAAYQPVHAELERQNQSIPGFPIFVCENGKNLMAVPFRERDPKQLLQAPANWRRRQVQKSRLLVVYPKEGDFETRCANGAKLLRQAATDQSLKPLGEVMFQPFFHLEDGEPPTSKLAAPVVRVSLPVE